MIVKDMRIENFAGLEHFGIRFHPRLAVLPQSRAAPIIKALGVILRSDYLAGKTGDRAPGSLIEAAIEASGGDYRITAAVPPEGGGFVYNAEDGSGRPCAGFYHMIHQCAEEESLARFTFGQREGYAKRLQCYRDAEVCYARGSFSALTDGIGNTRTFRSCLERHIREHGRGNTRGEEELLIIEKSGRFSHNASAFHTAACSGIPEALLFEYLCFLNINRFWQKVEAVRDFNHAAWPLIVTGLSDCIAGAADLSFCVEKALSLNRQVFIGECASEVETAARLCRAAEGERENEKGIILV